MSKLIDSILVELRPRLQLCNFFIITKKLVKSKDVNVSVNIEMDSIILKYICDNDIINEHILIKNCILNPKTLSGLQIENRHIIFRISTEPTTKSYGSFNSEIINISREIYPKSVDISHKYEILKQSCKLTCAVCTNSLTEVIKFDRVLPLPSETCNPDDWFCHKHEGSSVVDYSPKSLDCLYSTCSFIVNQSILVPKSVHFNKTIVCKRCLAWLGTNNKEKITFWTCTVKFNPENNVVNGIKDSMSKLNVSNICGHLQDFKLFLLNVIEESVGFICKIILECFISNTEKNYLLLWVLDKKLDVLYFDKNVQICSKKVHAKVNEQSNNSDLLDKINLSQTKAVQLLYRFETNLSDIVEFWLSDINVQHFNIALPILEDGLIYLQNKSKFMLKNSITNDGFTISYVFR